MSKYKEPVELSERDIEYRDHIIEELKSRTGASIVNIVAYKENQMLEPRTISPEQIVIEGRISNQIARMVISPHMVGASYGSEFCYAFREIANRLLEAAMKAGVNAL